jgi:hypothetical protein
VLVLVIDYARYDPIFERFEEKGELPQLTGWLVAFVRLDTACYHLPVLLVAIALLSIDEAAVRLLRQRARGNLWSWLWVVAAALAGFVALLVLRAGLLLLVFKMGSAVQ